MLLYPPQKPPFLITIAEMRETGTAVRRQVLFKPFLSIKYWTLCPRSCQLNSTQNGDLSAVRYPPRGRIACESIIRNYCCKRDLNRCAHSSCNPTFVVEVDSASESLGKPAAMNPATRVHKLKYILLPSGMTIQQYSPAFSHGGIT